MVTSTSYRLDPDLRERLGRRAATEGITVTAAAESLGVDPRLVRIAIDYAAEHLEEIEARLRANEEAVDRARKLASARASVLTG